MRNEGNASSSGNQPKHGCHRHWGRKSAGTQRIYSARIKVYLMHTVSVYDITTLHCPNTEEKGSYVAFNHYRTSQNECDKDETGWDTDMPTLVSWGGPWPIVDLGRARKEC